jgi:hypothetical protein
MRKTRLLLYSHAAGVAHVNSSGVDGSGNALLAVWRVQVPVALRDIVHVDLAACSIPGFALNIDEVQGDPGLMPSGVPYWRFVSGLQASRVPSFPEAQRPRYALTQLTISVLNPDGTRAYVGPHVIELEVFQADPRHNAPVAANQAIVG